MSNDYDCVHCDLPFVQLASNHLQRNIHLLPIYQTYNDNKDGKTFITVKSNSWYAGEVEPFYMVYFPEENHFQSIVKTQGELKREKNVRLFASKAKNQCFLSFF